MKKKLTRVIAINDISAFGKCALTVAIPVLSAMGIEVMPLITAVLSANAKFPNFVMTDFSAEMEKHIEHWNNMDIKTDVIYSGFLGSSKQIETVEKSISLFEPKLTLIDPIMGEDGKLYKAFDSSVCNGFKKLIPKADILTPNLTEACFLTDMPYMPTETSQGYIDSIGNKLLDMGAKNVIITGIRQNDSLHICLFGEEGTFIHKTPFIAADVFGTGDLFASVFLGKYISNNNIKESIKFSSEYVSKIIKESMNYDDYETRGLCFEPFLWELKKE